MESTIRQVRRFGLATPLLVVLAGATAAVALSPGDTLGPDTWRQAEGLLPPEVLRHYETGGYVNAIYDWPPGKFGWPPDFKAASEANAGRFDIGPAGEIVERATGRQPEHVLGFPFPAIDAADPKAGSKIIWNHLYRTYYYGNVRAESQVNMLSPSKLQRRLDVRVSFEYFDGVPEDERPPNPQNFLYRNLVLVQRPADVQGTGALTWRYRDPTKRDSAWTYVPALRRVRAVSPANRSDGFLGSDQSQDDGPFFDGKPEDFTWKVVGQVDQLRIVDPASLAGKADIVWHDEDGGFWRANWPDVPFIGYMDPAWKGLAWAPIAGGLAKRRFWVVEAVPKDRYYLFGKIEFYVDTVTFQGAWSRKYDWRGELLQCFQVMAWETIEFTRPDGRKDWLQGNNQAFQTVEAVKLDRASVAGIKSSPTSGFDGKIRFPAGTFDYDALVRGGK
ncbi:MAG TPA: DUF1329 domain-containing protein [Actinomycetota bacterium]